MLSFLDKSGFSIHGYDWSESYYNKIWRTPHWHRFYLVAVSKEVDPYIRASAFNRLSEYGPQRIPKSVCLGRDFPNIESALLYSCIKVIKLQNGYTEKLRPNSLEF